MDERDRNVGFDRYLSSLDVWAISFGCILGWGTFVMPGTTFIPIAGPVGTLIAMAISVIIILVIAANFLFLMRKKPGTGGIYTYTKDAFGRDHAFLSSWFVCLSYLTILFLNGTALFLVIRTVFNVSLQSGYSYSIGGKNIFLSELIVSIVALVIVGLLFILAKPLFQYLHTILSMILLAGAIVLAIAILPHVDLANVANAFGSRGHSGVYAIYSIVLLAPWAFVGFDITSFETSHFKFPVKRNKWIIIISIVMAGTVYAAMSLISIAAAPDGFTSWVDYFENISTMSGVESVPTFFAAKSILGNAGVVIIFITALAAILTGMLGAYRATTRVLSTMSEDKIISEKFSKTTYSIIFVMIISIIIAFLGTNTLDWFVELTSFGAVVGFGYTSASALKLARTENNKKVIVTSIIGTVISIAFAAVELIPRLTAMETMDAPAFLLLALWCMLGFLFYWRTVKLSNLSEYSGMGTSGIVLFALLLYSAIMWFLSRLANKGSIEQIKSSIVVESIVLLAIIFIGLIVMLYVQNLTRKKHEALEREKIRAVESSMAKSQFLFNMSHDIRTPMNAIIGYTELARKENNPPETKDYLDKIDSSSQHLLSLINDILDMSRIESGSVELEYTPCDIYEIFEDIKRLFSEQMRNKDISFSVHASQIRHKYVWCDGRNLTRVLMNLVSNAYKFTPEGGTVSMTMWEAEHDDGKSSSYEMRIQDNGIGMSHEFTEKMFTAFERERTSTVSGIQGTGLGLAITKSLVDLMDGTIEVLTSPGAGTEFIIRTRFEWASESDVAETLKDARSVGDGDIDYSEKRILLVEDNEINREIAMMILSQYGFMLETAENGELAVNKVSISEPGYYDLILMDIQMPVMDGYAATSAIRSLKDESLSAIPIIAMTANAFKEDEIAARDAGMQGHIAKPLDVNKMIQTINSVLKRED